MADKVYSKSRQYCVWWLSARTHWHSKRGPSTVTMCWAVSMIIQTGLKQSQAHFLSHQEIASKSNEVEDRVALIDMKM